MFIRRTPTRRKSDGEAYHTCRLVESRREGGRVCQITLLNLGRHFDIAEDLWPALCARLAQLLGRQDDLLPVALPEAAEAEAQRLAAQFVAGAHETKQARAAREFVAIDPDSLELVQPRSVGVEHVALHALAQLHFEPLLESLGLNRITRAMILPRWWRAWRRQARNWRPGAG